ncbi:universal stress protein [Variovorax sp. YR216]|uniref:universal stress protein n=1 Tax=Variovorax sp. YR216 TaxID=1882828 RepID=UPI00089AAD67|nr:universal stress protein [Variovorax sp. YR216]SEA89742.1 Nucleotide-binding universal stress protein, UspA family [Variovorax sp. YR216]
MHATNSGEPVFAVPHHTLHGRPAEIRSILAVTDFSAQADCAVDRAARLAVEHGATLKLMVASMGGAPPRPDAASLLAQSARALSARFPLAVRTVDQAANTLAHVADEGQCADLVVLAAFRESPLATFVRGHAAERLARLVRCPVLVVRRAAHRSYDWILVAVDFSAESKHLVRLACDLDRHADIQLFHAISSRDEAKLRSAEASAHQIRAYRQECLRYARNRILWLTDSFDARRNRVMSTIGHGDPARQAVVQQEYLRADLLVVGRRRRSPVADFFLGNVAERVLRWATSDVLIVPRDARAATGVAAGQRLRAEGLRLPAQAR